MSTCSIWTSTPISDQASWMASAMSCSTLSPASDQEVEVKPSGTDDGGHQLLRLVEVVLVARHALVPVLDAGDDMVGEGASPGQDAVEDVLPGRGVVEGLAHADLVEGRDARVEPDGIPFHDRLRGYRDAVERIDAIDLRVGHVLDGVGLGVLDPQEARVVIRDVLEADAVEVRRGPPVVSVAGELDGSRPAPNR